MKPNVTRTRRARKQRRSWLPAIGFYFIIVVLSAASFVFVLGLSTGPHQDSVWITAGLIAVGVVIAGIVLREVILRNVREQRVADRDRLDRNLRHSASANKEEDSSKFTLEKNAAALENIRKKSDAAKLFGRISAGHREVFELCDQYRDIVAKELPNVHPKSPRQRALSKGSDLAGELHRYHMLRWAELETRSLTSEAQGAETVAGKAAYAQRAKVAIEFALGRYPDDRALRESADVLDEILLSLNSSDINNNPKPNGDGDFGIEAIEYSDVSTKKNTGGKKNRKN